MKPTKKEIKEFAVKMASIVFDQANENETVMDFESKVPHEFVLDAMERYSITIKIKLAAAIEKDVTLSPDEYLETFSLSDSIQCETLKYQLSLRDFEYVISDFITNLYNKQNPTAKFDEKKINRMIVLTKVVSAQYAQRSKRSKMEPRKKRDMDNSELMWELSQLLFKARENKTLDMTSLFEMS